MNPMESEILEQPLVCAYLLRREAKRLGPLIQRLKSRPPAGIMIAARGSSDHAAVYGRYLLEYFTGIPVALAAPSLFTIYKNRPKLRDWLVIGISQSGQGPDICGVLKYAKSQKALCLSITNDAGSPLAKASHHVIALGAGIERAVAATKTYTAELAAMALLAALWSGKPAVMNELTRLPGLMGAVLQTNRLAAEKAAKAMKTVSSCVVVGRGFQLGNAHEMALKINECAGVAALSYSTADFQHGPITLARAGFPVFLVAAPGALDKENRLFALDVVKRGARVIPIGIGPSKGMVTSVKVSEPFSPLLTILPGQWFAYCLALAKGLNPAKPSGLKKVTKTR